MTLRAPLLPDRALALFASRGLNVQYVEAEIPGTFEHGGFPIEQLDLELRDRPELRVVHVIGWGRITALQQLQDEPLVWLVDAGGTRDFYWAAMSAGALED